MTAENYGEVDMKKTILILITVSSLIASGCASLRTEVKIDVDSSSGTTVYYGIESDEMRFPDDTLLPSLKASFFIKSTENGNLLTHQLYVMSMYSGKNSPDFYKAGITDGKELNFSEISSKVERISSSAIYYETFGLDLPAELVENNPDGIEIKVYGKSGIEFFLYVSGMMLSEQMKAINN